MPSPTVNLVPPLLLFAVFGGVLLVMVIIGVLVAAKRAGPSGLVRMGPLIVRDVTGDGVDDCITLSGHRLEYEGRVASVIDGKTGKLVFATQSTYQKNAALAGDYLVWVRERPKQPTAMDRREFVVSHIASGKQVDQLEVLEGTPELWQVGMDVVAVSPVHSQRVNSTTGKFESFNISNTPKQLAEIDTPSTLVSLADDDALSLALKLVQVQTRSVSGETRVVLGLDRETGVTSLARVSGSEVAWRRALGTAAPARRTFNAVVAHNRSHWFVPYLDANTAHLAALEAASGTISWDMELPTTGHGSELSIPALAAGDQVLALVVEGERDTLWLIDVHDGSLRHRYQH